MQHRPATLAFNPIARYRDYYEMRDFSLEKWAEEMDGREHPAR